MTREQHKDLGARALLRGLDRKNHHRCTALKQVYLICWGRRALLK